MDVHNIFEFWANFARSLSFAQFRMLKEEDIRYWSRYMTWPLVKAIMLSMGVHPEPEDQECTNKTAAKTMSKDFLSRLALAKKAYDNDDELLIIPKPRGIGFCKIFTEDIDVDTKSFIKWANEKFPDCPNDLFKETLAQYKSKYHQQSAKNKGTSAESVFTRVTEIAITELEAGCKCQHSELAVYLEHYKQGDGSAAFKVPKNTKTNQPSIIASQWPRHVLEATVIAFRQKNIPLRNEPKDEPRGRILCDRHRDWSPP